MSKKYILKIFVPAVAFMLTVALVIALFNIERRELPNKIAAGKEAEAPVCLLVTGRDRVSGLSDVVMLISLDIEKKSACIMQIPRDTYMLYGDGNHRKINSAAKLLGGENELCLLLSEALCLPIDGYVSLELDAFRKVVDTLGGVELELPRALYYSDPEQGLYINLPKGKQVLDGEKAEMLVRYRSGYAGGDLDRLDAQKSFMRALFATVKDKVNLLNAYSLAADVMPHLETDLSPAMLVGLGIKVLSLEESAVSMLTLPGAATTSKTSGASFYIMSAPATNRALCKYFGKTDETIDENKIFVHKEHENFCEIYEKDIDFKVETAENSK